MLDPSLVFEIADAVDQAYLLGVRNHAVNKDSQDMEETTELILELANKIEEHFNNERV